MDTSDQAINKVRESLKIPEVKQKEEVEEVKGVLGQTSIEKSASVKPELVPPMSSPILSGPSDLKSMAFVVASLDSSGNPMANTIMSFVLQGEEIKKTVLKRWAENLREIEEYVRQLLRSPLYIHLQEIRLKGDPQSRNITRTQGSPNASSKTESSDYLSSLEEKTRVLERVPPSAEVSEPSSPKESGQVLVLPLAAALLGGAGLSIATELVHSANPLGGVYELVQQVQSLFPQVSVQDLIPIINLMIVAPIYFNSWNEAVSNLKSGKRQNYVQTAQNFAKDVIKIVTDPNFVKVTLISQMRGTDQLSDGDQERLARMLKIVLIGVSLSLLYSVEVGKVQGGKFGGIEPEELRDLILGKWTKPIDPNKKFNLQEELTASLIKRIHEQMGPLSKEDREFAVNMLLNYINKPRELDPMLNPAKVFDETLASSLFNPHDKTDMFRA